MLNKNAKLAKVVCAVTCLILLSVAVVAQNKAQAVEGTYNITASGDQIGTAKFQMILKNGGSKWNGEIKDAPWPLNIESVSIDGDNNITISAVVDGNAVTMNGKYTDGKITGKWSTQGVTGDWNGVKQAPVAASPSNASASSTEASAVEGTYDAQVVADGQGTLSMTLIIKRDGEKLTTEVKDGGDLNIVGITLNGDAVTLDATYQGNPFSLPGKRNGQEMSGKWEAGGYGGTWSAKKRAN